MWLGKFDAAFPQPPFHMSCIDVHTVTVFRGSSLCTFREPTAFEDFVRGLPQPPARRTAGAGDDTRRVRRTPDEIAEFLAAHPWVDPEDLEDRPQYRGRRRRGRRRHNAGAEPADSSEGSSSEVDSDPPSPGDDLGIDAPAAVDPGLGMPALRALIAARMEGTEEVWFRVIPRGGDWTLEHTGKHGNEVRAEHRAGRITKELCDAFGWPKSVTYSIDTYTLDGALLFAREWVRRSTFFLYVH